MSSLVVEIKELGKDDISLADQIREFKNKKADILMHHGVWYTNDQELCLDAHVFSCNLSLIYVIIGLMLRFSFRSKSFCGGYKTFI